MNTPSRALVWEIWWRNRWAFAVLALLLVACEALSVYAAHLDHRALQLRDQFRALNQGSVALKQVLASSAVGPEAAEVNIKVGARVIYSGPLAPQDVLSWVGDLAGGVVPVVQVALNGNELSTVQPLPAQIIVSVVGGRKWTMPLNAGWESSEQGAQTFERARNWQRYGLGWSLIAMAFSLLLAFAVFGTAEPHSVRGFTGLPARRLTLPVSTGLLVAWPVGLGAATMVLMSLAWTKLVLPPLVPEGVQVPSLYFAVLLGMGLAMFQALVWGLPSFPKTRVGLITAVMLGLFLMAILPFDGISGVSQTWKEWQHWLVSGCAGAWVCALAMGWFGVRLERRGRWSGWIRSARIAWLLRRLTPQPPPFASPLQAQLWLEWRRNGRSALTLWTILVWLALGLDLLGRTSHPELDYSSLGAFAVVIVLGWIGVVGLNLARDGTAKRLPMSSFTAVRPLTTGALLEAKLIAGALLWLLALLILGASWFLCGVSAGYLANIGDTFSIDAAVAVLAISAHLFVGILPFCLLGRIPGFPWSMLPWLLVYGLILNAVLWFGRHQQYLQGLFWVLVLLVVIKLVVASWAFRRAIGLKLSSTAFVSGYLALWLVTAGFLVWMAWGIVDRQAGATELVVLIPAAALAIPLARVGLSPLALAQNRHR